MNTERATQKQIEYLSTLRNRITARINEEEHDAAQPNEYAAYKARQFVQNYAFAIKFWSLLEIKEDALTKRQASLLIDAMKISDNPAHFFEAVVESDTLLALVGEKARQFLNWIETNIQALENLSEFGAVQRYEAEQSAAVEQPESEPQAQTITVADGEEFEVEGVTFFVRETQYGDVYLLIPGGFAQDDEGEYWETGEDYNIRTLFDSDELGPDDYGEFKVTITAADLAAARAYRAEYPEFVPDED